MLVILLNCVTLGMYRPCEDIDCKAEWCLILQALDDCIFAFFAIEMIMKMVAFGIWGSKCYLGDTWNRLDFFIVMAGMMEYSLDGHNASLSAIRTVRVLRPLRAINRVPSMRILVTLLLDTLPMLGNVLLLCFFVFFIFGIVGVQLWSGLLRNRCFLADENLSNLSFLDSYYMDEEGEESPFICSLPKDNGMQHCTDVPAYKEPGKECQLIPPPPFQALANLGAGLAMGAGMGGSGNSCINWNLYYNVCKAGDKNPHNDAVNFDNIGFAWIAIFQVITLEGWVDIMYYVMDAHSFYNFIYFILLIIVGSFFMINLCLVVIATQFAETKQRENQLMMDQRKRYLSNDSTLASYSEPGSCYEEMLRYISHLYRKVKRRCLRIYNNWQSKRRKKVNPNSDGCAGGLGGGSGGGGLGSGGLNGHGRPREREYWIRAMRSLIRHHEHHHCNLSNGAPYGQQQQQQGGLETSSSGTSGEAVEMSTLQSLSGGRHSQTVPTVYQEGTCLPSLTSPGTTTRASAPTQRDRLNGGMNYPTILPSFVCSYPGNAPQGNARGETSTDSADPMERLQQMTEEPSQQRLLLQLMGGLEPGPLLLQLDSCLYCSSVLKRMEQEYAESENARTDAELADGRPGHRHRHRHRHPKRIVGRGCLAQAWGDFRGRLKSIVNSKYFNQGIMIAILINTLSMGIEYHEQPDELTDILEISNIVFTSMFVLEMLFKLLAFGVFGYIKNPYNIFDGIIVVISVWEIIGQADGGLSVLRTFRLLRVLKLVRFLPALRRQLVVLMKTMDNVATFCMLLMLFIFTFSILGMHLFGCKFSTTTENGDTIPDRKNFDSLLWAIVTVFQILTQEDWNVVLYNGMASTTPWAALYFVALMTFGNYVLFNLLVAILVEGFQAEGDACEKSEADDEKRSSNFEEEERVDELRDRELRMLMMSANGHVDPRGSLAPPIIMRTAATPMPTPKSSLGPESMLGFGDSRRGSGASIDPNTYDQRSLTSPRRSPCHPRGPGSNWGSRRSSWNSLSRAPSLKRKDTSGECESLLLGEGRGSFEDDDGGAGGAGRPGTAGGGPGSLDFPDIQLGSGTYQSGEYHDCNGRVLHIPPGVGSDLTREDSNTDEDLEDGYCYRLKKILESYKPQWCIDHEEWSLYLFSRENKFRQICQRVIGHRMFDHVVLVFIFLNCITIALEHPNIKNDSTERWFLSVSNYVFTVIFIAEMTVKVVALGFYSGKDTYLQSTWNVLDGILVFVSILDILVFLSSSNGNRILGILRVLRLLRTLRPLRLISRAPGLKLVVETLFSSLRPIGNIVLICCAFFIVFGILGVQLFKGKFFQCEGPDIRNITSRTECLQAGPPYRWIRKKYNFDNLGQALMSLFVLSCKDGWVNIMYDGLDAVAVGVQPIRNHNPWMLLYFISFLLIVSFFVLNMFVGVVVENFHKCRQDQEIEEAAQREAKKQRLMEKKRRKAQQRPYYEDYHPVRLYIHMLCTNHYLDLFITCIIGINVITMSMEHYEQPGYLNKALAYCNYVFTAFFVIEALLKLIAFGLRRFFKDRWNQLDLAIVLLSIVGITLEEINMSAALPINPTIIRIMRVLRIARVLKLLKMATGMRALLDTVMQALPQVGNLGLLFMLLFFIYAALGVELFGKLECTDENPCEGLSRHATFDNFGMAFLTLFRVSTGDNWNGIMKDTLRECTKEDKHCLSYLSWVSPIYFVTFVLMAQFVLVNVVVAVLMKHLEESNKEAKEEARMDAEIEEEMEMERRLSHVSTTSFMGGDGRGIYVGPTPDSPGQDEVLQSAEENPLSLRKLSVARMHSLTNDSYMFRPVRPASAPYPTQGDEPGHGYVHSGSVTSVHSQPCEGHSLLQVPGITPLTQLSKGLPRIPPPKPSPFKSLRRQEAIKHDSIEVQSSEARESLERQGSAGPYDLPVPHVPNPSNSSPQASPLLPPRSRSPSVRILQDPYGQRSVQRSHQHPHAPSLASSSTSTSPSGSMFDSTDPTDEEVRYINSGAKLWSAGGGAAAVVAPGGAEEARSHSLSPYASAPVGSSLQLAKNCGSAASLAAHRDKELKKFFSVDTKGFLDKPPPPCAVGGDDLRRHSIEFCPSMEDADEAFDQALAEIRHPPMRGQSLHIPRKKKTSPPCISVEALPEAEASPAPRKASASKSSTLLRRRTASSEQTQLQTQRDSVDLLEHQVLQNQPLLSRQDKLQALGGGGGGGEYQALPQIMFDQTDLTDMDMGTDGLSSPLLDTNPLPHPSPFEESTDFDRTAL
ncbi:voltage-dependent T-type calcium channel subunit alpha-1H [Alosa pseudoharengus]|uniref:voltage-dependent T-type calcium channel subunit alpha-1H n=1 Tax=Alosa pseudoharengus TaxID=34774 RepID=UPI003F89B689